MLNRSDTFNKFAIHHFFALGFILSFIPIFNAFAFNPYAKIHVTSVSSPLDWNSPTTLAKTIFANYSMSQFFNTGLVGHVFLEYQCSPNKKATLIGKDFADMNQVTNDILNSEIAYSIFFKDYVGKIESTEELKEFLKNVKKFKISSSEIIFSISKEKCQLISRTVKKARKMNNVTYRLSGGIGNKGECSSFVISLLKNANIRNLDELISQWTKTLYVPKKMLGDENKKISHTYFLNNELSWGTKEDQNVIEFKIIEPESMIRWIKEKSAGNRVIKLKG
jgi:hypothetical protein